MKYTLLLLLSLAAGFAPTARRHFSTANAASGGKRPPSGGTDPARSVFVCVDFVPLGDGTWKAVPRKPVEVASISLAAKLAPLSRDIIYRLYRTGFIEGFQPGPGKINVLMASLFEHIEKARDPDFWTKDRVARYQAGIPM